MITPSHEARFTIRAVYHASYSNIILVSLAGLFTHTTHIFIIIITIIKVTCLMSEFFLSEIKYNIQLRDKVKNNISPRPFTHLCARTGYLNAVIEGADTYACIFLKTKRYITLSKVYYRIIYNNMPCSGGGVRVTASSCRWSGDGYRRRRTGEPCARASRCLHGLGRVRIPIIVL